MNIIFRKNPKASNFMPNTLILQKVAYILASGCEGDWFRIYFQFGEKPATIWKKMKKH